MHHTLQTTEGKWSPSAAHPCFPFWASLGHVPNADDKELNYLPSQCALAFAKLACQIANCSSFCLLPLQKPPVCHANTLQFPACEFNLRSSVSTNVWNLDQVWCRCLHSHPSFVQQKSLNMSVIFVWNPNISEHRPGVCIIVCHFSRFWQGGILQCEKNPLQK